MRDPRVVCLAGDAPLDGSTACSADPDVTRDLASVIAKPPPAAAWRKRAAVRRRVDGGLGSCVVDQELDELVDGAEEERAQTRLAFVGGRVQAFLVRAPFRPRAAPQSRRSSGASVCQATCGSPAMPISASTRAARSRIASVRMACGPSVRTRRAVRGSISARAARVRTVARSACFECGVRMLETMNKATRARHVERRADRGKLGTECVPGCFAKRASPSRAAQPFA